MNKRVATHNTLHAALYTPEKHCTTGFKQLVKDDITRILQKAKPAWLQRWYLPFNNGSDRLCRLTGFILL